MKPPEPPDVNDSVRIDIREIEEARGQQQTNILGRDNNGNSSNNINNISNDNVRHAIRRDNNVVERFSRSHSTGHSIVRSYNRSEDEEDRYTLRLPEHLKVKLLRGRHHWTGSCETYGEFGSSTRNSNERFAEVSGV